MARKRNYEHYEAVYQAIYAAGYRGWWEVLGYGPNSLAKAKKHLKTRVLRYPFVPHAGTALELGCGDGIMTVALAKQGYRAMGIDISPTVIRKARKQIEKYKARARFIVGDTTRMTRIVTASVTLALDMNCLHTINTKTHRLQMLKEVSRILVPEGVLYIATMTTPMGSYYSAMMKDDEKSRSGQLFKVTKTVRGRRVTYEMPLVKRAVLPKEQIFRELLAAGLTPVRWQHRKSRTISDLFVWAVRADNHSVKPSRRLDALLE